MYRHMDVKCIVCAYFVATVAVHVSSIGIPEQIHISFGDDHTSMVIMWASRDQVNGSVQYGVQDGHLNQSEISTVSLLPAIDYNSARYIHRACIKGLLPDTRYYYQAVSTCVEGSGARNRSSVYSFTTVSYSQSCVSRFLVYGDMGAGYHVPTYQRLTNYTQLRDYKAIWHVGDFAYDLHTANGQVGDVFLQRIQPFAAHVPYMVLPGNHGFSIHKVYDHVVLTTTTNTETSRIHPIQKIERDFIHYRTRFSTPDTDWPIPLHKMWYSYDVGLVHFISYSTEVYFTYSGAHACEQFYWLLEDLIQANSNRERTPWIVAMGHRPMYCSNKGRDDCTDRHTNRWVKHGLEDLFYAQGVDLIIEAHEHSYERLWPTYDSHVTGYNYNNPTAPVHVISGAAGNSEDVDWMKKSPAASWSAFRADEKSRYTFGNLEIHNETHLYFEQREAIDDSRLDSFWLVQTNHRPFVINVTCNSSQPQQQHPSCSCPPLQHDYMVYIIVIAVSAFVLTIVINVVVVWRCLIKKRKRKQVSDVPVELPTIVSLKSRLENDSVDSVDELDDLVDDTTNLLNTRFDLVS